jgi:signal transduction histidine kinase
MNLSTIDDAAAENARPAALVSDLRTVEHSIALNASAREVFQSFRESPAMSGATVVDPAGALLGLISRRRCMEIFSQPYRMEVYFSRPLETLLNDEFPFPLCIAASATIDVAAQDALARPRHLFYEPIAVDHGGGCFSILEPQELLHALAIQYKYQFGELQSAKDSLVQAEKLASLGGLVAGVAHEINTPIGVSLSAASYLADKISAFNVALTSNQVRKADLNALVADTIEASDIILRNMERAATLVSSFKRVAADQTSESRRIFDLKQSVGEILFSLGPSFKHSGIQIEQSIDDDIEMDSYPGALAQIISNLVLNAQTHAFGVEAIGTIRITASLSSNKGEIKLSVHDNGCGIDAENLARIFDPFFTTRRNQGGTGLGLHIVHNLIHKTLAGSIQASSTPGSGTRFDIRIPRVTPTT